METSSLNAYVPTTSGANVAVAVAASSTNGVAPVSGALACKISVAAEISSSPSSSSPSASSRRSTRRHALEPRGAPVIVHRYRNPSVSLAPAVHAGAAFHQVQFENGDDRSGVAASHAGSCAVVTASAAASPRFHISASTQALCAR